MIGIADIYMEVTMGIVIASAGSMIGGINAGRSPESPKVRTVVADGSRTTQNRAAEISVAASRSREIQDITQDLEQISLSFNRKLQFVVDHKSNEVTVKVIDRATDKVIKVLPPEELQRLHNRIKETIGFLFDERV
jgi:flagellar protein FlaG